MRLNDIWRKVNKEIGFYTKETFDKVPTVPGVYAWFYPLRITTKDPHAFIREVNTVLNYDASTEGKPIAVLNEDKAIKFAWKTIDLNLELNFKKPNLDNFISIWNEALKSEKTFHHLKRVVMKSSIIMPPLYVGKTTNLYVRCAQHINGNDRGKNFHSRYVEFVNKNDGTVPKSKIFEMFPETVNNLNLFFQNPDSDHLSPKKNIDVDFWKIITDKDKELFFRNTLETVPRIRAKKVSDLLFICIRTDDESIEENDAYVDNLEWLVEEIMKFLARPPYSRR